MPEPKNNPFIRNLDAFQNDLTTRGTAAARAGGMDPRLGGQTAQQAVGFGMAYNDRVGAAGGMSGQQASRLDQELRMSAADSPLANAMGAAMAMAQAGVLGGPLGQKLLGNDKARNEAFDSISKMGPAGLMSELKKMGVDQGVAANFMNAKRANQQQISQFGIQDKVREAQGIELAGIMTEELADSMAGSMRGMGGTRRQRRAAGMEAGNKMQAALQQMAKDDPTLLTDSKRAAERTKRLAEAGNVNQQVAAGAYRDLEEKFMSDPQLGRLGGVSQALTANRKDVLAAGPAEAAKRGREAAQGGGGDNLVIKIMKLVMHGDGSAELEGSGAGPGG